jgi:putative PIN family toxin of toxin-antitoxin system
VSALWSDSSIPAEIIKLIPKIIVPCFSCEIFLEYTDVLKRPKFDFSVCKRERLLFEIKEHGEVISPNKSDIPMPDETDRKFYDTAKQIGAILISGNLRHYPAEPFIIMPSDFLRRF